MGIPTQKKKQPPLTYSKEYSFLSKQFLNFMQLDFGLHNNYKSLLIAMDCG